MANPTALSPGHIVLEAVRHVSNADVPALRQLAISRPNVLKFELILRIVLTYLPEGTDPDLYVGDLRYLSTACSSSLNDTAPSPAILAEPEISEEEAHTRVRRLHLLPLADPNSHNDETTDPFTLFLIHQAHKIESETGSLDLVAQLLEPFIDHSKVLRTWMISILLPLLRLDYEYYPLDGASISLSDFEKLDGSAAIQSLLSRAARHGTEKDTRNIGRDLRGLVGPWMFGENGRKRRKLNYGRKGGRSVAEVGVFRSKEKAEEEHGDSDWTHVNKWLLELGLRDFPRAVDGIVQWDGPGDVDYGDWGKEHPPGDEDELRVKTKGYAQACLATLYATSDCSMETIIGSHRVLMQAAKIMHLDEPSDLKRSDKPIAGGLSSDYVESLSKSHLLYNTLLRPENPFTHPAVSSISLFNLFLTSCYKLLNLGNVKSHRSIAELALFSSESEQIAELRATLHRLKTEKLDEQAWASTRRQILWLHNWKQEPDRTEDFQGIFSKVAKTDVENELLHAMVDGGCYRLASDTYCELSNRPLPMAIVEDTVLKVALSSYDAASNGNRTRGGVRKASEIILSFHNYFPQSMRFSQTSALLTATHAMSFYSLTLEHGVPFQPVNIRAHKDPMSLIGKILSQNLQSYTHLDDMLDIGQNLVSAGLKNAQDLSETSSTPDPEQQMLVARRRITRMAIEAALGEDDFDTAYSYVVNRLSLADQTSPGTSNDSGTPITPYDDISWRAAYQAGRYPTSKSNASSLRPLEQRMELLSQALLLAPPSALSEILAVWQALELEMSAQIAREAQEEKQWNNKADKKIPGGFSTDPSPVAQKPRDPTRGVLVEEAPMGLFEVARGAASALSKNAFPLRGVQKGGLGSPAKVSHERPVSMDSAGSSGDDSPGGQGRVRKRDMVSNMVTGGLASGIGWVIGKWGPLLSMG